ncbi:hypothetical protein C2G38_2163926 [Gigaspora rosea]|uniref:Uncharacterized protein n=1 Tax=Gigaspora rosea TaxID=44941 RepID=A0A397VW50_9GLOM|nr:hypothetical protein C2G38_2163926 [Gigaspora rosea]
MKKTISMNIYGSGHISEESTFNFTPIYKEEPTKINTIYQIFTHLSKDTDIILVLKSQITARISVIPNRYIFGKIILRIFSTEIPLHEITTSLFTTQVETALHPYGLLKEEIKEEAYYCVTISDKEPLQIIAHQGTPGIKINIYKNTNNQPFIGKYYYVIALFDNLLEDEIAIKVNIWHEYIYIKEKSKRIYQKCHFVAIVKERLNTPKAKKHRKLYHQKKSIERRIQKLEKFLQENPDYKEKIRDSEKGKQIMLSQRIHPYKPYLGMIQGTRGKVDVYTDNYGYETLETEEDAVLQAV